MSTSEILCSLKIKGHINRKAPLVCFYYIETELAIHISEYLTPQHMHQFSATVKPDWMHL